MASRYTIGLDYGTNSVRALIARVADGEEIATSVCEYRHGDHGVIGDPNDPNLARQHPQDYLDGTEHAIRNAIATARKRDEFEVDSVVGIGVDTTGSTPLPVDRGGAPLAFSEEFAGNAAALAWLWKDHTAVAEAEEITAAARESHPEYLKKYGGAYSSEWYWSKILHCARQEPVVSRAAYTWLEIAEWIPAQLCGTTYPDHIKRSICAAGHKAMFHPDWGGYPDPFFLGALHPDLARVRRTLPTTCHSVRQLAGHLSPSWARRTELSVGIPVTVGALDAHLGGVGAGIRPGVMVKTIGTSTCDVLVRPAGEPVPEIPGLCGIVPDSIVPGTTGLEAGQSAVGDVFNWFVNYMKPGGDQLGSHSVLTNRAAELTPGSSGLLALDWLNGNRSILVDPRLTGMIIGLNLHTRPEEIYRALIEATAFGARVIMERMLEYRIPVEEIVTCGGIANKNPLLMQIYADVLNRPLKVSRSEQTAALGSAIAAAVAAGPQAGGRQDFSSAIEAMTGTQKREYHPSPGHVETYDRLYHLYKAAHDAFGGVTPNADFSRTMKALAEIRTQTRTSNRPQNRE